jgi:hypothetical protein
MVRSLLGVMAAGRENARSFADIEEQSARDKGKCACWWEFGIVGAGGKVGMIVAAAGGGAAKARVGLEVE